MRRWKTTLLVALVGLGCACSKASDTDEQAKAATTATTAATTTTSAQAAHMPVVQYYALPG